MTLPEEAQRRIDLLPKMKKYLIFLICFGAIQAEAQVTKPKIHEVELFSGKVHEGKSLVYDKVILREPLFKLDTFSFQSSQVAFFKNNHGHFANLAPIHGNKSQMYAMRIRSGKLDLYEKIDIEVYGYETLNVPSDIGEATEGFLVSGEYFQYYRKGKSVIKRADYRNLRIDLANSESSMVHLKNYRFYQFLQIGLIAAGAAITTVNVIGQDSDNLLTPIGALGIVVIGCSFFTAYPKRDLLWQAVEVY